MSLKCFDESHDLVCIVGLYWPPSLSKTENRALYKQRWPELECSIITSVKHFFRRANLQRIFFETFSVGTSSDTLQTWSNLYSCQVNSRLWNTFLLPHLFLSPKLRSFCHLKFYKTVPPDTFECFVMFVISPQARICSNSADLSWDQNLENMKPVNIISGCRWICSTKESESLPIWWQWSPTCALGWL